MMTGLDVRVRVNRVILAVGRSHPVFPEQRTSSDRPGMSQTWREATLVHPMTPGHASLSGVLLRAPRIIRGSQSRSGRRLIAGPIAPAA
jgi:hypothetical protein